LEIRSAVSDVKHDIRMETPPPLHTLIFRKEGINMTAESADDLSLYIITSNIE